MRGHEIKQQGQTDRTERKHNLYWQLCWASVLPRVYKLREKGDEITFTHCASHSSSLFNSSGNIRALGKNTCRTTLSLSSKDRLLCNATVFVTNSSFSFNPHFLFILWLLYDISGCLFCSLLPVVFNAKSWPACITLDHWEFGSFYSLCMWSLKLQQK